jgi:hypothetical protein
MSETAAATEVTVSAGPESTSATVTPTQVVVEQKAPEQIARDQEAKANVDRVNVAKGALAKLREREAKESAEEPAGKEAWVKQAADRAEGKGPDRNPDGKFKGADKAPEAKAKPGHNNPPEETKPEGKPVAESKDQPEIVAKEPASPAIPAPRSWSKEMQAKWDKLEPEVQEYLSGQDKEVARHFSRYGQAVKQAEPVMKVAQQYRDTLSGWGWSPDLAFKTLLDDAIERQSNPKQWIANAAQHLGVNLANYVADIDPSLLPPDPRLEDAQTELLALRRETAQWENRWKAREAEIRSYFEDLEQQSEQEHQSRQLRTISSAVDSVMTSIPDLTKHTDALVPIVQALRAQQPDMDLAKLLQEAWEIHAHRDPTLRQAKIDAEISAREKARAKEQEAERTAQLAASRLNVSGQSLNHSATPADDRDRAFSALSSLRKRMASQLSA